MVKAYLCLGSNKGNRVQMLEQAVALINLSQKISITKTSSLYETEPWGEKNQNWFVNMIAEIETELSPHELLFKCNEIEKFLGRNREKEQRWGERFIDIDIIFFDKKIINDEQLTIPHKYMHERAFVLVPLLEIIPEFVHPIIKKTITDIYNALNTVEDVYLYGTKINELESKN